MIALEEILQFWGRGGWLMLPLVGLAFTIFYMLFGLYFTLASTRRCASAPTYRHWVNQADEAPLSVQAIVAYTQAGDAAEHEARFTEIRTGTLPPIDRRIHCVTGLIAATPLAGLLGTVHGMLRTFEGLASPRTGRATDIVADGIAQALITTETGLAIAIPASVLVWLVQRSRNRLERSLAHLETATHQLVHQPVIATEAA